jgi:beta-phosphoglucomutase family hydrolase
MPPTPATGWPFEAATGAPVVDGSVRNVAALDGWRACLFDLDGVLTPTAELHMLAWSRLFTGFLAEAGAAEQYTGADYFAHIDGKPRYDGVRDFLASRGLRLPEGQPTDSPEAGTVCGLGNRKNLVFSELVASHGVRPYPGSVLLLDELAERGIALAVVSSSRNARVVLAAAGLADRFRLLVDADVASRERLAGKPAPDTYAWAARHFGVPNAEAVVFEDAVSGVAAGRAGGFGLVVGVDRGVGPDALRGAGADLVVSDLGDLVR